MRTFKRCPAALQRQPESGGGLSFPVAGVDLNQTQGKFFLFSYGSPAKRILFKESLPRFEKTGQIPLRGDENFKMQNFAERNLIRFCNFHFDICNWP